ncbi:hypothetical protein ABZ215_00665 [Amycolatopsis sp. NPDC006131]|uniref:hypothetical protein n=1 Tax=Amycolatopsis sp. NPDC006131 TaxID=3156731 RepID=UPI0033B1F15F
MAGSRLKRLVRRGRLVPIAWAIGVPLFLILFYLGSLGDSNQFWTSRPFQTNLFTALTGATVAVPFALTVLNWFARNQDEEAQWSATKRYAEQLVTSLERSLWPGDDYQGVGRQLAALSLRLHNLDRRVLEFNGKASSLKLARWNGANSVSPDPDRVRAAYKNVIADLFMQLNEISDLGERMLLPAESADVASIQFNADWQTIDRVIRPTIAQNHGPDWIPVHAYKVLSYRRHDIISREELEKKVDSVRSSLTAPSIGYPYGIGYGMTSERALDVAAEKLEQLIELRKAVGALREALGRLD